jgi:endonuclease/exonuclease/phosphatase family metal-dependent hydrolase
MSISFPHSIRGYSIPKNPFEFYKWIFLWFQHSFLRPSFLIGRVFNEETTLLLIVNCHLVIGINNDYRIHQVKMLIEEIKKSVKKYNCNNVVLCGDFNSDEYNLEYQILKKEGFNDSIAEILNKEERVTWHNKNVNYYIKEYEEENKRIDYIWTLKNKAVSYSRCFDKEPFVSDHYGVSAKIEI